MKDKTSDVARARQQYASLTSHYRAIGPAAINAALICAPKKPVVATPVRRGR